MTKNERFEKFYREHPLCWVVPFYRQSIAKYVGTTQLAELVIASPQLSGRCRTREIVRARDNYTCQDCKRKWKTTERRFDVHHLNGQCGKKSKKYDKVSDIDSLITLCHKCHFNRPEHLSKIGSKRRIVQPV